MALLGCRLRSQSYWNWPNKGAMVTDCRPREGEESVPILWCSLSGVPHISASWQSDKMALPHYFGVLFAILGTISMVVYWQIWFWHDDPNNRQTYAGFCIWQPRPGRICSTLLCGSGDRNYGCTKLQQKPRQASYYLRLQDLSSCI